MNKDELRYFLEEQNTKVKKLNEEIEIIKEDINEILTTNEFLIEDCDTKIDIKGVEKEDIEKEKLEEMDEIRTTQELKEKRREKMKNIIQKNIDVLEKKKIKKGLNDYEKKIFTTLIKKIEEI
ncbi:hypothetical protein [Candidatus Vampirococcus lugosii]|uniref:Uncharacterized protein n=1 Tax=Candidatus Vampirococcus lugosii TaxID=2789015 RepID=A0ABS5QMJ4_9BACT|nr:hypothetical protein [Candidatus Vampirococcus lugosii]MBS8122413.1 hypothetical protein [Candidatus Vampirococcus lugosii]